MGLLSRLFKSDPQEKLNSAEALLAKDRPEEALRLAGTLATADVPDDRAVDIVNRARAAVLEKGLARAATAEESGYFADAAEWLETVVEYVAGDEKTELDRRIRDLLSRADQAEAEEIRSTQGPAVVPEVDDADFELGEHDRFETLINTLDDDIADLYDERPEAFREAYVELNEGDPKVALAALDQLLEDAPDDHVFRLERGRTRLTLGEHEGAREDFEAVWERFGDEALDHARSVSLPSLWAESMLGLGRTDALVERLDGVAVPNESEPVLLVHFATALIKEERLEEAESFLLETIASHSKQQEFSWLLARALHLRGQTGTAIDTLERAVAPSCSPAGCNRAPAHPPSLRFLVELHLKDGKAERAGELLVILRHAQNGYMSVADLRLLAEFHRQSDDPAAAEEAEAAAKKLEEMGEEAQPETVAAPAAIKTGRAVL